MPMKFTGNTMGKNKRTELNKEESTEDNENYDEEEEDSSETEDDLDREEENKMTDDHVYNLAKTIVHQITGRRPCEEDEDLIDIPKVYRYKRVPQPRASTSSLQQRESAVEPRRPAESSLPKRRAPGARVARSKETQAAAASAPTRPKP